ncbi:ribosome hibernation-promoting factor, HPF/YfiA family [Streptomyces sp. NPDC056257]|uniref:ribosome hibernation-promoting factor, HPF/YfiA family n=1 Tax=Streptomyces sp. NPDC056257 TaxID=3345765 RepID=UPI0035DA3459
MQVNISGQGVEVTVPLREYLQEKLKRLESHYDWIAKTTVIMKAEGSQQKIEAILEAPDGEVTASADHQDMYAAINQLTDRLERQLKRLQEKRQARLQGIAEG